MSPSKSPLHFFFLCLALCTVLMLPGKFANAQSGYTWDQVKSKFETANPTLQADAISVQEMKSQETTAYLRPNPQLTLSTDGTQIARYQGVWKPTAGTQVSPNLSYLHEREHKRELRLESAQEGTQVAASQHQDLERNLLFNLRATFVQTLQAKAILDLTRQQLDYYDHIIDISRARFKGGDLAQIDLDRIELQRVQYESICKPPRSICAPLRSSCYSCWTTEHR